MEVNEMVPLPDNDEIALEYDELVGYELMGKDDYTVGKLRKTYSVTQLLNGIEKKEERMQKYKKNGDERINIHIHDLVKDSGKAMVGVDIDQKGDVKIDIKVELPALQKDFRELKREVADLDDELKKELVDVENELLEITPNSEQGKINKAINKISGFMDDLSDKESRFSKLISKTKKGIEAAQKLGKTYNKFAQ
jgi:hypothetical protein